MSGALYLLPGRVAGRLFATTTEGRRQSAGGLRETWWSDEGRALELRLLGRSFQRQSRALATRQDLHHLIEVSRADLALMANRGVTRRLGGELRRLELRVRGHSMLAIVLRQGEHRMVEAVEPGQGDELELVSHGSQLALELGDGCGVELAPPVEGRRAVVGQHLAGELRLHRLREGLRVPQVG